MPRITLEAHDGHVDIAVSRNSRLSDLLGQAADILLYALAFLIPLFYLSGLREPLELPKQLLLLSLVTVTGILWLVRVFLTRSLMLRKSFLFFPILLFSVGIGISTLTSIDRYTSLFGGVGGEYVSFASLVGFLLFVFFVATSDRDLAFVRRILLAVLASSALLSIITFLKLFGVTVPVLAVGTLGSAYILGVFEATMFLLASGLLLFEHASHREFLPARSSVVMKVLALVSGIIGLAYLVALDWWVAWLMLIVGTGLLMTFVFVYAHTFRNLARLLLPLLGLVLAILFLFMRTPINIGLPVEVAPGQGVSWQTAQKILQEHPALGSGPATYILEYVKNRPETFASTVFWNVRFDRAASYALTLLPTVGLAGAILWLLLLGVIIGFVVRSFLRERDATAWLLTAVLFLPWIALVVSQFLYGSNLSISFVFWLLTALLLITTSRETRVFTFAASPRSLIGTSLGAVVFAVLMIILLLLGISRASAWFAFGRAINSNVAGDFAKTREELVRASDLDPRTDVFWRNVANVRLLEASSAASSTELQNTLNAAVTSARRATEISPADALNWITLGAVYREMSPAVSGSGELALAAFGKARELEPPNPSYPTEMARVEIILSERARAQTSSKDETVRQAAVAQVSEHLTNAERYLNEAIALKQNFDPAHFYNAIVLERQGKLKEAIAKMQSVANYNQKDVGVAFQLGLLYLENRQPDKAEVELKRAIQLAPTYSNAHWYLAAIYESQGKMNEAISEVQAVLDANPDNQAVKDRLAKLKGGTATVPPLPEPVSDEQSDLKQ